MASARTESSISAAMSRRMTADSHFWVKSKLRRRGVVIQRRMAAQASTTRKIGGEQVEVYRDDADARVGENRLGELRPCSVPEDEDDVAGRE